MSDHYVHSPAEQMIAAQASRLALQDGQIASLHLDAEELERQVERIGAGLWEALATAVVAAEALPGEPRLVSRVQAYAGALAVWSAVVDGGDHA